MTNLSNPAAGIQAPSSLKLLREELERYLTAQGSGEPQNSLNLSSDYVRSLTENGCVLNSLTEITAVCFEACCGRCVLGYEGLFQLHTILSDISNRKGKPSDFDLIAELSSAMQYQSACDVGKAAGKMVGGALAEYEAEIKEHVTKKTCRASFCKKFVTYHILSDKCVGCEECADVCEDDAIEGKKKFVHVIDQDECTQCGKCVEACEYDAILKAGAIKPKCPSKPVPCTAK